MIYIDYINFTLLRVAQRCPIVPDGRMGTTAFASRILSSNPHLQFCIAHVYSVHMDTHALGNNNLAIRDCEFRYCIGTSEKTMYMCVLLA